MSSHPSPQTSGRIEETGCPFITEYTHPVDDSCGRRPFDPSGFCVFHAAAGADKEGPFWRALEDQSDANFEGYVFPPNADFALNDFPRANFARAVFTGDVSFAESVFAGPAVFDEAVFQGRADFSSAEFRGFAGFWRARWENTARFYRTDFLAEAVFIGALFQSEVGFTDVLFARGAQFQNARFLERALFLRTAFLGPVTFQFVELSRAGFRAMSAGTRHERIARLSLATCEFRLARGLEAAQFDDVDWGERELLRVGPFRFARGYVVYDETLARIQGDPVLFRETEQVYRALRRHAERQGDRRAVAEFHYGEREMERLALPRQRRRFWSLSALYWLLAGYGERPERPAGWLVLLWLLFGIVYGAAAELHGLTGQPAFGFAQSAATMTWLPGPAPAHLGLIWWEAAQRVATLALVALLVLSLARRFRR